jgi:peptidoglycan/xylan/chitin deacetylase (PgdA/CDA1 family)
MASCRALCLLPQAFQGFVKRVGSAGVMAVKPGDFLESPKWDRLRICITFDDGGRSVVKNALPCLSEVGFSSTMFLLADKIGRSNDWDISRRAGGLPLADEQEIREWIGAGQRIGSHGCSHLRLTQLSPVELRREVCDSKKSLEDRFGVAVDDFCYPYGDTNPSVAEMVESAGYATACTTMRGINTSAENPYLLKRVAVEHRRAWLAAILPGPLAARV